MHLAGRWWEGPCSDPEPESPSALCYGSPCRLNWPPAPQGAAREWSGSLPPAPQWMKVDVILGSVLYMGIITLVCGVPQGSTSVHRRTGAH